MTIMSFAAQIPSSTLPTYVTYILHFEYIISLAIRFSLKSNTHQRVFQTSIHYFTNAFCKNKNFKIHTL